MKPSGDARSSSSEAALLDLPLGQGDAIRRGESFDQTRSMIADRSGSVPHQEDGFILPHDAFWTGRAAVARPALTLSRRYGGRDVPYRPRGYW